MSLVIFFQQIRLPTKQNVQIVSKISENCKLFDKCIFDNISQLIQNHNLQKPTISKDLENHNNTIKSIRTLTLQVL